MIGLLFGAGCWFIAGILIVAGWLRFREDQTT